MTKFNIVNLVSQVDLSINMGQILAIVANYQQGIGLYVAESCEL